MSDKVNITKVCDICSTTTPTVTRKCYVCENDYCDKHFTDHDTEFSGKINICPNCLKNNKQMIELQEKYRYDKELSKEKYVYSIKTKFSKGTSDQTKKIHYLHSNIALTTPEISYTVFCGIRVDFNHITRDKRKVTCANCIRDLFISGKLWENE